VRGVVGGGGGGRGRWEGGEGGGRGGGEVVIRKSTKPESHKMAKYFSSSPSPLPPLPPPSSPSLSSPSPGILLVTKQWYDVLNFTVFQILRNSLVPRSHQTFHCIS